MGKGEGKWGEMWGEVWREVCWVVGESEKKGVVKIRVGCGGK